MEFKKLYLGKACADNGAFSHFVFVDDEGNQIGIFCDENASFCTEQEKAYAKLFAAAPEMHDWQSDALAEMRRICPMLGVPCDLRERLEHLIERGEEIQKKARGEK